MNIRASAAALATGLLLAGCTGSGSTGAPPAVQEPLPRAGLALAQTEFDQVWLCGPGVTHVEGSNGKHPCSGGGTAERIQRLQDELREAEPAAADAACASTSPMLTLALSKKGTVGFHPPSVEVLVDCGLARRIGSRDHYRLADSGRQLLSDIATGKSA